MLRGFELMKYVEGEVELTTPATGSTNLELDPNRNINVDSATDSIFQDIRWNLGMFKKNVCVEHPNETTSSKVSVTNHKERSVGDGRFYKKDFSVKRCFGRTR